ncbi:hypothetical protein KBD69_03135 [Candidatus Woesebacteria bacterium]|nr:hypothetical protein [Candidatus Woesebacteria bacterium]
MNKTEIVFQSQAELINFVGGENLLISRMLSDHPAISSEPRISLTSTLVTLLSEDLIRADEQCALELSIQKFRELSLVNIPSRAEDIHQYLYPDSETSLQDTKTLIELLSKAALITYKDKGYHLDTGIRRLALVEYELTQPEQYAHSHISLLITAIDLQTRYPEASSWYDNMLPDIEIKQFTNR